MQSAVSQQGSLCGPNLTSQDFPWKWNVHWIAPMIEAPQTVALHPKQLDMSGCCFMKKRLFMPSDALPGKEPLRCSTRLGSCFPSPTPYHARIITMRRWGNGLGYEANDDVTWLFLIGVQKEKESAFRVCMVNLLPSHSLFYFQWPHLLGGPIVVFPRLYPAPRMAMMEPKILPYISV